MSHKFSKTLAAILAAVMVVALVAMAACTLDPNAPQNHTHTFEEGWTYDETNHWHKADCGHDEKSDVAAHNFDDNGKCTVCGYEQTTTPTPTTHTHSFEEGWTYDEYNHWHKATCEHNTVKGSTAAHVFNDEGKCTVCNYQQPQQTFVQVTQEVWEKALDNFLTVDNFSMDGVIYDQQVNRWLSGNVGVQIITRFYDNGEFESTEVVRQKIYPDGTNIVVEESYYDEGGYNYRCYNEGSTAETLEMIRTSFHQYINMLKEDYSLAKWDEQTQSYSLILPTEQTGEDYSFEVGLKFVDGALYEFTMATDQDENGNIDVRIFDINKTEAYFPWDHTHEVADYYESDGMYHWHPVTCPTHVDKFFNKTPHTFNTDGICTVCGYSKTTAVTHTVTKEQWKKAFLLDGVENYVIESFDGYGTITESHTYNGWYIDFGDGDIDWTYFDGTDYYLLGHGKEGGVVWKELSLCEGLKETISMNSAEEYIYSLWFCFDNFTYDEATGMYRSSYLKVNDESPLAIDVTFCDGELQKIHFYEPFYGYTERTVTFGVAEERTRADHPLHTEADHVWEKEELAVGYHSLRCTVCGEYLSGEHDYDENGLCRDCGIEQTHKFVYDPPAPDYIDEKNNVVCGCFDHTVRCETCELTFTERCDDKGDSCSKCGKENKFCGFDLHDFRYVEGFPIGEDFHILKCTKCGHIEYFMHNFEQNPDECSDCHFRPSSVQKHIHTSDKWYIDEYGHEGLCKDCGKWVDQSHDFVDGVCIVCKATEDGHVWTDCHPIYGYYDYWQDYHCGICSDCGMFCLKLEHNFDENNVCTDCGMEKHIHTVETWNPGQDRHFGECTGCGSDIYEDHVFDENYHCDKCGFTCTHEDTICVDSGDGVHHTIECRFCHKQLGTEEHTGTYEDWGDKHSFYCYECGVSDTGEHTYNNDENYCDKCGHPKEDTPA